MEWSISSSTKWWPNYARSDIQTKLHISLVSLFTEKVFDEKTEILTIVEKHGFEIVV